MIISDKVRAQNGLGYRIGAIDSTQKPELASTDQLLSR